MDSKNTTQTNAVPWSTQDTWVGVGSLFILLIILMVLTFFMPDMDIALFLILGESIFLIPVWFIGIRKYRVKWSAMGLRAFNLGSIGIGCGLMVLSWLFNLGYGLFLGLFSLRVQPDFAPLFSEAASPAWVFFGGALVAPLVEEIIFRGFIFAGLQGRYGWKKSALISAGLFAMIHFQPAAIIPIFILGLIFAYLYHLSGSIWPAVIMHMSTNALGLGAVYFAAEYGILDLSILLP
ncbi:MAG: CPBP family intramembrane metalloprotease [Anaerolineales bacterium]|nr:CPBP family intramembrane metalloprotease [Anaerolineales bacterium]